MNARDTKRINQSLDNLSTNNPDMTKDRVDLIKKVVMEAVDHAEDCDELFLPALIFAGKIIGKYSNGKDEKLSSKELDAVYEIESVIKDTLRENCGCTFFPAFPIHRKEKVKDTMEYAPSGGLIGHN